MLSRRALLLSVSAAALQAARKSGEVEIGVCGSIDDFAKAEQFGFDYFEPAAAAVAALSNSDFADFEKRVSKSRIRCECFNSFIRTLQVVGPAVERKALTTYMNTALDRCRALGGTIIVWGSASSRNVPEGYSRDLAWQQIKTFLAMAGEQAKSRNIVIAIEPLRKQESNIINNGAGYAPGARSESSERQDDHRLLPSAAGERRSRNSGEGARCHCTFALRQPEWPGVAQESGRRSGVRQILRVSQEDWFPGRAVH